MDRSALAPLALTWMLVAFGFLGAGAILPRTAIGGAPAGTAATALPATLVSASADRVPGGTGPPEEFYLEISTTVPGGSTIPTSGWFPAGTPVDIYCILPSATLDERWVSPTWTGTGYNGPADNPDTLIMSSNRTQICDADHQWRHLFLTNPTGLPLGVDGGTFVSPMASWWYEGSSHVVECLPSPGWTFEQWDDGSTENPRTFVSDGPETRVCTYSRPGPKPYEAATDLTIIAANVTWGNDAPQPEARTAPMSWGHSAIAAIDRAHAGKV